MGEYVVGHSLPGIKSNENSYGFQTDSLPGANGPTCMARRSSGTNYRRPPLGNRQKSAGKANFSKLHWKSREAVRRRPWTTCKTKPVSQQTEPKLFLQFLSTAKVTQFATDLAQDLARRYPPAMANNPVQMVSEKRLATLLASSFEQAQKFALENRLGFIRKAILSNSFKWTLKDLGYKDLFIQIATEGLVVHITRKPTASKP